MEKRTKIVECVLNFSEGKDSKKIEQIAQKVREVKGVKLLDIKPDKDHNRTVLTFIGEPEFVKQVAFQVIEKTKELIDMSEHKGQHPRMGATDVCPFIPIQNTTMEECVMLAHQLGEEVGEKLQVAVYLYQEAAKTPERRNLDDVRKGEYEALREKLREPYWQPDYGPAVFDKKFGAITIGARIFLLGFNVNLDSSDIAIASAIAKRIRETGTKKTLADGNKIKLPGLLKSVKAIGIELKDQGLTQIGMNLTNYKITPAHVAFETIKKLARKKGVELAGSEIIGVVLKDAILCSGRFYAPQETNEKRLIEAAVENLGLDRLQEFIPEKKIIEYMI